MSVDLNFLDKPVLSTQHLPNLDSLIADLKDTQANWEDRVYQPQGPYFVQMCRHRDEMIETIESLLRYFERNGKLTERQERLARKLVKTRR